MKVNDIIEKKQFAAVTCLDQSACFDIIDHKILIAKLSHIGFDINSINLIKSYFFKGNNMLNLIQRNQKSYSQEVTMSIKDQ